MAPKMTADEIRQASAGLALEEGWVLREEQSNLAKRVKANKAEVHGAMTRGHLSDDQTREALDLYPERERVTPQERVTALEAQLAKARERADAAPATVDDAVTDAA